MQGGAHHCGMRNAECGMGGAVARPGRLLKKVQVQGGARYAERGVLGCTPQRVRKRAIELDPAYTEAREYLQTL